MQITITTTLHISPATYMYNFQMTKYCTFIYDVCADKCLIGTASASW